MFQALLHNNVGALEGVLEVHSEQLVDKVHELRDKIEALLYDPFLIVEIVEAGSAHLGEALPCIHYRMWTWWL